MANKRQRQLWQAQIEKYMSNRAHEAPLTKSSHTRHWWAIAIYVGRLDLAEDADRRHFLALRQVSVDVSQAVDRHIGSLLRSIAYTYPPRLPQVGDPHTQDKSFKKYWRIFHDNREGVKMLRLRIRPVCHVDTDLASVLFATLLDLSNLEVLKIMLVPPETTEIEGASYTYVPSLGEETVRLWSWPRVNFYNRDTTDVSWHYLPLVTIRVLLEENVNTLPSLRTLTFRNLSIAGIQALQWGHLNSATTYGAPEEVAPSRAQFWGNIRTLHVHMVPWWGLEGIAEDEELMFQQHEASGRTEMMDGPQRGRLSHRTTTSPEAANSLDEVDNRSEARTQMDNYRQGMYQLHAWLRGFSAQAESVIWCWMKPAVSCALRTLSDQHRHYLNWSVCYSINPFLLGSGVYSEEWFTPTAITWKSLKSLRIAENIHASHTRLLLARMKKLTELMVFTGPMEADSPSRTVEVDENGRRVSMIDVGSLLGAD